MRPDLVLRSTYCVDAVACQIKPKNICKTSSKNFFLFLHVYTAQVSKHRIWLLKGTIEFCACTGCTIQTRCHGDRA